jgi:predicted ATPase
VMALVGRDEIVSEIAGQLLRRRLVTITGTGEIGKTAVALAHTLASTFQDSVQRIDVASLARPDLIGAHLASVLRLSGPDTQQLNTSSHSCGLEAC